MQKNETNVHRKVPKQKTKLACKILSIVQENVHKFRQAVQYNTKLHFVIYIPKNEKKTFQTLENRTKNIVETNTGMHYLKIFFASPKEK